MAKITQVYKYGGQVVRTGQIIAINIARFKAGKNVGGNRSRMLYALKDGALRYKTIGRRKNRRILVSVEEL